MNISERTMRDVIRMTCANVRMHLDENIVISLAHQAVAQSGGIVESALDFVTTELKGRLHGFDDLTYENCL